MNKITKELLFQGLLSDKDLGNLDLNSVFDLSKIIEDGGQTKENKENNHISNFSNNIETNNLVNEKDLNLEVMCIQNNEKIYRLSDLLIPIDPKKTKKIESFLSKIMTSVIKDKNEKEDDIKKKEKNEKEEIKNLIKKSSRNQASSNININYNEKFFDKTVFSGRTTDFKNIYNENYTSNENSNNGINNNIEKELHPLFKDNYDYSELIQNDLFKLRKENLKEKNMTNETIVDIIDDDEKNKIEIKEENFEKETLNFFNKNIMENVNKINQFHNPNKSLLNHELNDKSNNQNNKPENNINFPKSTENSPFNNKIMNQSIEHLNDENSIESSIEDNNINNELFFNNKNLMNYSILNSKIIKAINENNNNNNNLYINDNINKENNNSFKFSPTQKQLDKYDLYNYIKKKRNRAEGYYNQFILKGSFKTSIILTSKPTNDYIENSKAIYDLNDYNMNFEIVDTEKENNSNQNFKGNNNNNINEDFFSTIPKNQNYSTTLKIGNSKGSLITHAKCAYNFTYNSINLTFEDLKDFHRPNFCKNLMKDKQKRCFSIKIGIQNGDENDDFNSGDNKNKHYQCYIMTKARLSKKEKNLNGKNIQYMNAYEIFKHSKKLSLIDGKFALFEHIDEYPLFVSNFGMANKMKKYLYSSKLFMVNNNNINNMKLSEAEMKTYNMIGPNGTQIILKHEQKLPLLGQIDLNEIKGMNIIDNNLYRAPVFYEKINFPNSSSNTSIPNKKRYNFLLTFHKNKEGKKVFYIRELEHLYTVAQEEPKVEVYPPQSRQFNTFLKNKIETYTYRLYNEIGYKAGINFKVFTNLFPAVTEQVLKRIFKEMNIEIDKNICFFKKIPGEINQKMITPENICQYESCQFGIYKLREVGIANLTNADKISYATNKFNLSNSSEPTLQFLAKIIEEELLTTPWNITQNYLQSKQIKGMLAIKGFGDPSNGNGGYSFLKMPVKSYNENKTLKEEMDILKNQNKNIKTVTGTDADLRKLSKEDIKIKLIELGIDEDLIQNLGRWKRVNLLRQTSSQAVELGYKGDIVKYARNQRFNTKSQREAYQKNINEVFKKQINYILNGNDIDLDEDKSDGEYENPMIEKEDGEEREYYNFVDDCKSKKNSMSFMRNVIYPNKKKSNGKK